MKWNFQRPHRQSVVYPLPLSFFQREAEVGWPSVKLNTGIMITKKRDKIEHVFVSSDKGKTQDIVKHLGALLLSLGASFPPL